MMEILRSTGERGASGIPAHHHNVEEWSNMDPFNGILEHNRVETDHWANNTHNSSHQYGKVVDSRARNLADGTREQMKQMKQLEVFQARVPGGGSVQVIRSHTSTTSSKHKAWLSRVSSDVYLCRLFTPDGPPIVGDTRLLDGSFSSHIGPPIAGDTRLLD
ncbi:hypothetical protein M8J77_000929 [Diaphorina citri]|nr:hypothetical protein M8J77_000929 [Diaphorina citri]